MSAAQRDTERGSDDRLLDRMLFFSDAVFAIVLTLLVLELRPPEGEGPLLAGLSHMAGRFIAFFMSFGLVSIFWIAHMNTLRLLKRFDWGVAWTNLIFLAPVSLMPFASSLLGERGFGAESWSAYSLVLILTSACMLVLVAMILRGGGRLSVGLSRREAVYRLLRAATPGLAFAAGLAATTAGHLELAHFCWVLIPLIFLAVRPLHDPPAALED